MNSRFQNALRRVPQEIPPIWFMRQAGRYHKHYQKLRAEHSFMELCKNPCLAAEVALGPIEDFDFDVSILFSDLLFPLEALGMGLRYDPAPQLDWHLNPENFKNLRTFTDAQDGLRFQAEAMQLTRRQLPSDKSLIGFVGGPWTLFAYAVEGAHRGGLEKTKSLQSLFPRFCEILIPLLRFNIELQLKAGAEVVMLFDTAAGELSPSFYQKLVVPALAQLVPGFEGKVGYYAKGVQASHFRHSLFSLETKWAGLGFDHRWDLRDALTQYPLGFVQGNFDQGLLFLSETEFRQELDAYLKPLASMTKEARCGWVSGLGHGVLPGTPEANVRAMVRHIREVLSC